MPLDPPASLREALRAGDLPVLGGKRAGEMPAFVILPCCKASW
jgi:hypothetical protein